MSGSADVEDDATMTRDAGASRTFRSIFGDSASQDGQQDELKIQRFSRHSSGGALIGDSNGYRDSGGGDEGDDDDDDDEGVWSDDAAPPKERGNSDGDSCEICLEDDGDNNNGDERIVDDSAAEEQEDANAGFNSDASAPRAEDLKIPHRRSMEEWADDDDEEDTWKDMLQAKVNQLELVIQNNSEATAASSSQVTAPATTAVVTQLELAHHVESRIALAAATHTVSLRGTADRPANRNKIQRTSGAQSHASGDHSHHSHHRHVAGGGGGGALAVSSPSNYLRKRSGSRDFASSRTSRSTDAKKSAKVTSGSGRRESMARSSSASSISSTHSRSSHAAQRKNSLDACNIGSHSRNNGNLDVLGGSTSSKATAKAPEPIRQINDAEAVRRFILHDIKQMSMDRIVADTKRLRFLEDFYQQKRAEDQERAAAAATAESESTAHCDDNKEDNGADGDAAMVPAETPPTTS